ncbi:hypothetical protein GOODEAATRI_004487 [Goodea atripinnis]|uniref:Uncharacterized protein n=1 Tax=Goodea atripinnis TaxID=208336 RepID=A0ABV0P3B8_9TELE
MSKRSNQAGIADLCLSSGLQKFAAQNCLLLFVRRMESPRVSFRRPFAFFHALWYYHFIHGCTTMFVSLRNVGEINSTVLQSENLSSITRFESKNSGITGIAENAFSSLSNLKVLILDGNRLSNINQNWFRNPAAISELALSFNGMEDLNESNLKGLTNLKKLKLNGNRIQTIHPDSFSSQSMLTDLDLSENRLMRLSPHIFSSLKSLMFIRLYGNPWNCSCDAQDFDQSRLGCSGHRCPEEAWRRSFTGIRAKSANAIILSSPFCVSEKDTVTSQTEMEVPSESSGKQDLVSETGAEMGEGCHLETFTTIDSVEECVRQEGDTGSLYKNQECAHVNTDVIPYLSIGTKQNKPSPDKDSAENAAPCSQRGKFMRRISTWPPTASQWQARCKRKEEEGEEVDEFAVWSVTMELSEDVKIMMDHLSSSNQCEMEKETDLNLRLSDSFKPPESPVSVLEEEGMILDPGSVRQAHIQVRANEELKSEKHPAPKNSSKANVRKDQKRSVTIRQRAENRAAPGSKAPSGGASPDDETLLSGNEYAFMDLLHEVVQNNGRWTRERWKQIHLNKQRR